MFALRLTQITRPTSLQAITHRIVHCEYAQPALFEQDMLQLFSNARTWYGIGTPGYKEMVTLQRLYQQLTPSKASMYDGANTKHVKARSNDIDLVDQRRARASAVDFFSSSAYGPGNEPHTLHEPHTLLDAAWFKGRMYRTGDWVHLMNPVDPSRPIVAQIFRVYKRRDVPGTFLTANWYYRPEQTSHGAARVFYENEVLKTGIFGDHVLEDIVEEILVLFHTKYARARPKAAYSAPQVPTYIVESKYDVARAEFHKIQSWASCVPTEVREKRTPMDVFAVPSSMPPRQPSLLTTNAYAPGFGQLMEHARVDDEPYEYRDLFDTGTKEEAQATPAPPSMPAPRPPTAGLSAAHPDRLRAYAAFHMVASDIARRTSPASYEAIQAALLADPDMSAGALTALSVRHNIPDSLLARLRDAARSAGVLENAKTGTAPRVPSLAPVLAAHRAEAQFTPLPHGTAELFRRDAEGRLLWYAAPPLDGWHASTAVQDGTTHLPLPSLEYLYATVRKT